MGLEHVVSGMRRRHNSGKYTGILKPSWKSQKYTGILSILLEKYHLTDHCFHYYYYYYYKSKDLKWHYHIKDVAGTLYKIKEKKNV